MRENIISTKSDLFSISENNLSKLKELTLEVEKICLLSRFSLLAGIFGEDK